MKQELNYRFINPNSEEETIKKLISICIAANTKKIEDALFLPKQDNSLILSLRL